MIGFLKGTVYSLESNNLILDVSGVGYLLLVDPRLASRIQEGKELSLYVYTDVKENSISLFGFSEAHEKEVFLLLKKVKGVGSKLAQIIVSSAGSKKVLNAIGCEDSSALQTVPGVGKKTAQRIIVELGEQVALMFQESKASGSSPMLEVSWQKSDEAGAFTTQNPSIENDVILALQKLGFKSEYAKVAVQKACAGLGENADSGELLRKSLALLS